jgi:Family of unknown function (DUF6174)
MRKSLPKVWLVVTGIVLMGGLASYALMNKPQPPTLLAQIDQTEQKWQAQHIARYRIQVQHVESIWHLQVYTITVEDGNVVAQSATCSPAPMEGHECKVHPFDANDYTVAGLFATARSAAKSTRGGVTVTFDQTRGFPQSISSAPPDLVDADNSWRVLAFDVLA